MNSNLLSIESNDMFITSHLGSDSLPGIVQNCLNVAKTTPTKDMLLLSLLTNCAYALPAMRCYHGVPRHEYGPDLMTMVLAPAASGKGVMNYGRKLMKAIEGERGKSVYIPANASSAALIALMQRFRGRGIIMATEMDTLSQTLRSSYGQFSDVIRCLFEHETISQLRRQNNEFIEITDPRISMVLTGLRLDPSQPLPEKVECSDEDFKTVMLLGHKLLMHAAATYDLLPVTSTHTPEAPSGSLMQKQFLDSLPEAFSKSLADDHARLIGVSVRTKERWLTIWTQTSVIQRNAKGEYQKVA